MTFLCSVLFLSFFSPQSDARQQQYDTADLEARRTRELQAEQQRRHMQQLRDLETRMSEAHKETHFFRDELTQSNRRV